MPGVYVYYIFKLIMFLFTISASRSTLYIFNIVNFLWLSRWTSLTSPIDFILVVYSMRDVERKVCNFSSITSSLGWGILEANPLPSALGIDLYHVFSLSKMRIKFPLGEFHHPWAPFVAFICSRPKKLHAVPAIRDYAGFSSYKLPQWGIYRSKTGQRHWRPRVCRSPYSNQKAPFSNSKG